jgi:hypothetical protein
VKKLQVESVRSGASVRRLIREGVSKLEGEPLVITVTRAASLGGSEPVESASAGCGSTGTGGAELVGW